MALRRLPLLLAIVLAAAGAGQKAGASTLYLRRLVVAEPSQLTIGDLLRCSEPLTGDAARALERPVGAAAGRMLLLPSTWFSRELSAVVGADTILVGRRSLVVPGGLAGAGTATLLDRLMDWLESLGGFGAGSVELELVRAPSASSVTAAEPAFELLAAERASGLYAGAVEVSVRTSAGPAERVSFRVRQELPVENPGVRAGDPVTVVMRRGAITIEMEGKALSSAAAGKSVTVRVTDGERTFAGTAERPGVVNVDAF